MKAFKLLFIVLFLLGLTFATGCKNTTDSVPIPRGEECTPGACGRGPQECINGYCHCEEGTPQLARGFCINSDNGFGNEFVTYDQYDDMLDTMVIAFDRDPYETEWVNGDNRIKWVPSYAYNRNLGLENPGGSSMMLVYSDDPENQIGLVKMFNLYDKGTERSVVRSGSYYCVIEFNGYFVDRNTIQGNIHVWSCPVDDDDLEEPRPADLPNVGDLFPVTFTRL